MFNIIQHRKIYFIISAVLVCASVLALIVWGLKLGIDFTGGTLWEIEFVQERPDISDARRVFVDLRKEEVVIQGAGEKGMIVRLRPIAEHERKEIFHKLKENFGEIIELRFDAIGPTIGAELSRKAFYSIVVVVFAIIAYIAWSFRKISKVIASWQYGVVAVIALLHDILIPIGVFSVLGKFLGIEITSAFVAAILTVLGYSVNDTIVVFDRVRENLIRGSDDFETTVNNSVNQTLRRSINTSLTTLLVLLAIFFWGGETIRYFSLVLIIGIVLGTYSSIFIASPLLVFWLRIKAPH